VSLEAVMTKVAESAVTPEVQFGDLGHLIRVSKLMGRVPTDTDLSIQNLELVSYLWEKEFCLFVNEKIVMAIPYAAEVRRTAWSWGHVCGVRNRWYGKQTDRLVFIGNIPEAIITAAELLPRRDYGVNGIELLTVHSFLPMPTEYIIECPVMIGWVMSPTITCDWTTRRVKSCSRGLGVVVGVWDIEREIDGRELLRAGRLVCSKQAGKRR